MGFALRPYQQEAYNAIFEKWKEFKNLLLVNPTGTGKTVLVAHVTKRLCDNGERVLILAHREELLKQAQDKLYRACGLETALEKAESTSLGTNKQCVVGSVQTLCRSTRLEQFSPNYFQTIIIDEAHHALSASYRRIINHFSNAKLLGVTATPDRGDKKSLSVIFDEIAYEYSLKQAIRENYLSPIEAELIPVKIDLSNVSTKAGDYDEGEVGEALEPYLESIADEMAARCMDRKTVCFLPLIATAQTLQEKLLERGFRCAEVNGQSPDRNEILADFDAGRYNCICNSMLLTEGWDCPSVDCIVVLRPTKVRALFCQMVGRGTRLYPNKEKLLLLDFLWNTTKHDLCTPASLVAKNEDIANRIDEQLKQGALKGFGSKDILALEDEAESTAREEREAALARQLAAEKWKKAHRIDPVLWGLNLNIQDVIEYEPIFRWQSEPPTEKQLAVLERFNFDLEKITTKGLAARVLNAVFERKMNEEPSVKQIQVLIRAGFRNVEKWTKAQCSEMITLLKDNGWKAPIEINDTYSFNPKDLKDIKKKYESRKQQGFYSAVTA